MIVFYRKKISEPCIWVFTSRGQKSALPCGVKGSLLIMGEALSVPSEGSSLPVGSSRGAVLSELRMRLRGKQEQSQVLSPYSQ